MEAAMSRFPATCAATSRRSLSFLFSLLAALSLAGPLPYTRAAITPIGNVTPSNPSPPNWDSYTWGYIGNTASGTLTVNSGSHLYSQVAYIGYGSTATGRTNITGAGSSWSNGYNLNVGYSGSGSLSITNGGSVSSASSGYPGYIGCETGSSGTVTVDGAGSKWNTSSNIYVGNSGNGILTITNRGIVTNDSGYIGYSSSANWQRSSQWHRLDVDQQWRSQCWQLGKRNVEHL